MDLRSSLSKPRIPDMGECWSRRNACGRPSGLPAPGVRQGSTQGNGLNSSGLRKIDGTAKISGLAGRSIGRGVGGIGPAKRLDFEAASRQVDAWSLDSGRPKTKYKPMD